MQLGAETAIVSVEEDVMSHSNQPDWDKIAEKFDLWLPHIAPVGETLLQRLDAKPGDRVLDVASGTGEPALTLAQRMAGHITIIGTDAAPGMVRVAQAKVQRLRLDHIHFENLQAEKMRFGDASFDRVLCRFGVMLFEDPLQGLKEIRRVLKRSGRYALSVWSTPETMPTMYWSFEAFKNKVPEQVHPPLEKVTSLGVPGLLDDLLTQAGFREFTVERHTLHYQFTSFNDYWNLVEASDILKAQFDALPADARTGIRDEVAVFAQAYQSDHGLMVPHDYLVAFGDA
jgi:ubiquinone/menaquinone biosynthesis C-methylase UbiE